MTDHEDFLRKTVQYLNNSADDALRNEIEILIERSSENKRIYNEIIFIWNNLSDLQKLEQLDKDEAVAKIGLKLAELHQTDTNPSLIHTLKRWVAAAAALLLIGLLSYWQYNKAHKVNSIVKSTQNAIDSVTLADGSKIYLDNYTTLSYPDHFSDETREISLVKGQAFFKIHRDIQHPFIVKINRSSVTVLGTSFNINSHSNQIELNVSTGRVRFQPVAGKSDGSILLAGTGITYDEATGRQVVFNPANQNNQVWLTHEFGFVDASLTDVCKQLETYYKVKINLSANTSGFEKLNARFKDNKLSEIIDVLKATYPIKVHQLTPDSIVITSTFK